MSQITPNLYIGSAQEASNIQWLKSRGITHIVNMAIEHDNYFPRSFRYFKGGIYDPPNQPLIPALRSGYSFRRDAIGKGGMVFVHCHAGISRSSSMVLYYLMKTYHWTLCRSLLYMKRLHPRTSPNTGFLRQLSDLQ